MNHILNLTYPKHDVIYNKSTESNFEKKYGGSFLRHYIL